MTDYGEAIPTAVGYYVYRLWAGDGTCLYVGRIGDSGPRAPQPRLGHHRRNKTWWPDVAKIEVAELPDHPAIVAEEVEQIRALRPLHNIQRGNCGHDRSLPGAVRPWSGNCSECAREYDKKYQRSAARVAYRASPGVKAKKRDGDRKRQRPSGSARAAIAKRRPSGGQAPLW